MAGAKPTPSHAQTKASAAKAATQAWQADPTYQATYGALKSQLAQYGTNLQTQANRYDQQYGEDLQRLGWQDKQGHAYTTPDAGTYTYTPKVTTGKDGAISWNGQLNTPHANANVGGEWNQIDPLTSSGKAFTDEQNDYGARGMVQSTGYVADRSNLTQSFNNQLHDAQLARQHFLSDLGQQNLAYNSQQNDTLNQAKLQAMANQSAQYQSQAVRAAAGL